MTEALIIQGGGSPLRVFAVGADPAVAALDDVLFDANYPALRHSGIVSVVSVPPVPVEARWDPGVGTYYLRTLPWNTGTFASVPLGKTYPAPPYVVSGMASSGASGNSINTPYVYASDSRDILPGDD